MAADIAIKANGIIGTSFILILLTASTTLGNPYDKIVNVAAINIVVNACGKLIGTILDKI